MPALLAALSFFAASSPAKTVWVSHKFIGGPKCVASGPVSHFEAPGFESERAKLKRASVPTQREFFRDEATCEACHKCPNYAREIFFEIDEKYLPQADKAGYRRSQTAPSVEELSEYENSKRYRPKSDRPDEDS